MNENDFLELLRIFSAKAIQYNHVRDFENLDKMPKLFLENLKNSGLKFEGPGEKKKGDDYEN